MCTSETTANYYNPVLFSYLLTDLSFFIDLLYVATYLLCAQSLNQIYR